MTYLVGDNLMWPDGSEGRIRAISDGELMDPAGVWHKESDVEDAAIARATARFERRSRDKILQHRLAVYTGVFPS